MRFGSRLPRCKRLRAPVLLFAALARLYGAGAITSASGEEIQTCDCTGIPGGSLVTGERAEPRTLNPVLAVDAVSREVIGLTMADLIHVDGASLQPAPALAKSWTRSPDGKRYILQLRHGLRFSDGHALDADDVIFTFQVHLDERVHSAQRDFLTVGGKPVSVRKLSQYAVEIDLASPYAGAERLFDGIAILPKHLLEESWRSGKLGDAWKLDTPPAAIAGMGPFRLKEYVPGQRLVLEKNPWYWKRDKSGERLPYLDEIVFVFVGSEDNQVFRFQSGETQLISGISPDNFYLLKAAEQQRGIRMSDAGPGLEYTFLLLNMNQLDGAREVAFRDKQRWFRDAAFREAVSLVIDRDAVVRLVYRGMASPLSTHVTPGNRDWFNRAVSNPPHSEERARALLKASGYSIGADGVLLDPARKQVAFTILVSAGNTQRLQIATIVADDLQRLGIRAQVVSLEFRAMLDRIFESHEYDAAIMTLASGDTDPNAANNALVSRGGTRLWDLNQDAATDWEQEIDRLMRTQMTTLDHEQRKTDYDRVQELVARNLPFIAIAAPHVLGGAAERVRNLRPSILQPYLLWNADQLYLWRDSAKLR